MANVVKFDTALAREIQSEMATALQGIAQKYNISIVQGGGSVGPIECKLSFQVKVKVKDQAAAEDAERAVFNRFCHGFGLKPEHFGAMIVVKGETRQLVGLAPNRPKYPIKLKNVATGETTLWTTSVLAKVQVRG